MISLKDLKIITQLRQNARMPLTDMSRKIQIPVSTIFERLKNTEDELILRHTTLLDFSKLGYHTRANIIIRVDKEDKKAVQEFLLKHHAINSVYRINNGYDFFVEAIFRQIKELEDFLELMEQKFKIAEKRSFFVIEDLKREQFMSDINLLPCDLIMGEKAANISKNPE